MSAKSLELELEFKGTLLPTVLLQHNLPNGSHHVDWMLAPSAKADSPLVTFRLPSRLDELPAGGPPMEAERIGDHRPDFLEFQGELTGNRGSVSRLRRGVIASVRHIEGGRLALKVQWESQNGKTVVQSIEIRPPTSPSAMAGGSGDRHAGGGSRWLVICDSIPPGSPAFAEGGSGDT